MVFYETMPMRWLILFMIPVLLFGPAVPANAEEAAPYDFQSECSAQEETETQTDLFSIADEYIDMDAIQSQLSEGTDSDQFSFSQTIRHLLSGQIPFEPDRLLQYVGELFLGELRQQKNIVLQILVIVLSCAVFSNFIHIFKSSQIAEIGFYMIYFLVCTMLLHSFVDMSMIGQQACNAMYDFMKVLLPSYLVTVVLCAGSISAVGFYEITVLGISLMQGVLLKLILPAIHFYMIVLLLNQIGKEDYFSQLSSLIETMISWSVKTILGVVLGLQAVQCLIAPAVDSMKNSGLHRLAKAIPGVGSMLDSALETVAGSALIIKNAVGIAGILALSFICLLPIAKLAACMLLFKLLCALIQPISEKRMVAGIESLSKSIGLILRVLVASLAIFVISLAMITASITGG